MSSQLSKASLDVSRPDILHPGVPRPVMRIRLIPTTPEQVESVKMIMEMQRLSRTMNEKGVWKGASLR